MPNSIKRTSQAIHNVSFDETYEQQAVEMLVENEAGTALVRQKQIATKEGQDEMITETKKTYAVQIDTTTTANVIYIGKATIGSAAASAVWQVKKIATDGISITWADSNGNFDNIWNNRSTLTYG